MQYSCTVHIHVHVSDCLGCFALFLCLTLLASSLHASCAMCDFFSYINVCLLFTAKGVHVVVYVLSCLHVHVNEMSDCVLCEVA